MYIKNYIIAQPQGLKVNLAAINTRKIEAYPQRTVTMEKIEEMIKDYAIGFGLNIQNLNSQALDYFLKVEKNTNFEKYLPPYFKVYTYFFIASEYLKIGNVKLATVYAQKSVDTNHDLNKSFNDWPGLEYDGSLGEVNSPWIILGDVYLENKDYQKAKELYQRALRILPDKDVANKLRMVETALSQAK